MAEQRRDTMMNQEEITDFDPNAGADNMEPAEFPDEETEQEQEQTAPDVEQMISDRLRNYDIQMREQVARLKAKEESLEDAAERMRRLTAELEVARGNQQPQEEDLPSLQDVPLDDPRQVEKWIQGQIERRLNVAMKKIEQLPEQISDISKKTLEERERERKMEEAQADWRRFEAKNPKWKEQVNEHDVVSFVWRGLNLDDAFNQARRLKQWEANEQSRRKAEQAPQTNSGVSPAIEQNAVKKTGPKSWEQALAEAEETLKRQGRPINWGS